MGEVKTFTLPKPLETAVLFLIFRRPDTTKQVFEQIRKARPPRLYIAADGPRENVPGEAELVRQTREYVLNNIDWNCEVKILFRDKNLGCGRAVSEAITWFFEHEEMGIILEDDTVPSLSFFWFCEELLKKYKDDMRVGHIAGYNHFPGRVKDYDYFFSLFPGIWGWASWKSRWKYYDFYIHDLSEEYLFYSIRDRKLAKNVFEQLKKFKKEKIDTWDYQWMYSLIMNGFLCIRPSLNLVYNIGFRQDATHTQNAKYEIAKNFSTEINIKNLKHPRYVLPNLIEDMLFFKKRLYHKRNFITKFLSLLRK